MKYFLVVFFSFLLLKDTVGELYGLKDNSDTQYKYEDELLEETEARENYEKEKDRDFEAVPDEDSTGPVNGVRDEPYRMLEDPLRNESKPIKKPQSKPIKKPQSKPIKKPPIIEPKDVNVTCGKHEMSISIPKYVFYGLEKEHLRLLDVGCVATETPTHFILRTGLTKCHTSIRHTKNFVCYMNTVLEVPVQKHQIITRVHEVEIPFSCYYSNMGVVSSVGLQVKSKKIVFSKKGFGEFELQLKVYPDSKYVSNYKKKDFPLYIPLRKLLYVEASVVTKDDRLQILAETCFASPDPDPSKPGLKYFLIKDGCAVDETLMSLPASNPATDRFKFEAFKFLGDHQFVYLHCKVKICNATDPNSRCAQGCIKDRHRRSLYTEESQNEEYTLAEGPFMQQEEDNKLQLQDESARTLGRHTQHQATSLVAAFAVVATVCLVGFFYFVWDKKRSAVLKYQKLPELVED